MYPGAFNFSFKKCILNRKIFREIIEYRSLTFQLISDLNTLYGETNVKCLNGRLGAWNNYHSLIFKLPCFQFVHCLNGKIYVMS